MTKKLIGGDGADVCSFHGEVLRSALASIDHMPETLKWQKNLTVFMAEKNQQISQNDLLAMMKSSDSKVDFARALYSVSHSAGWPQEMNDLVEPFMKKVMQAAVQEVLTMTWVSSFMGLPTNHYPHIFDMYCMVCMAFFVTL